MGVGLSTKYYCFSFGAHSRIAVTFPLEVEFGHVACSGQGEDLRDRTISLCLSNWWLQVSLVPERGDVEHSLSAAPDGHAAQARNTVLLQAAEIWGVCYTGMDLTYPD